MTLPNLKTVIDAKPTSKTSKVDRGAVSYSGAPKAKESTVYDGAESAL